MALVRSYFKHVWDWEFFRNWDWRRLTKEELASQMTTEIKKKLVEGILVAEPRIKTVSIDSITHEIDFKEYEEYRRAIEVTLYYYEAYGTTTTHFSVETEAASPVPVWLIPLIEEIVKVIIPLILIAIIAWFVYSSLSTIKEAVEYLGEKGVLPLTVAAGGAVLILVLLLLMGVRAPPRREEVAPRP